MVYNSFMNGIWGGNEQRLKNIFKPNTEMDIRIRISNNKFQVVKILNMSITKRNLGVKLFFQ